MLPNDTALKAFLDARTAIEAKFSTLPKAKLTALVMGVAGTGKTTLAATCPKPVLLDCFDEGGWRTKELQPLIADGSIIVRSYEHDEWKSPTTFERWRTETRQLRDKGFFNFIGTYMLDSYTSWSRMLMYQILKSSKAKSFEGTPDKMHYKLQLYTMLDIINDLMALPCNVLITAHLAKEIDELNGGTEFVIEAAPSQRSEVPNAFLEKWVMRIIQEGGKSVHKLQLYGDGQYRCGTRIGDRTTFKTLEDPNVREIMRKAGMDCADKMYA